MNITGEGLLLIQIETELFPFDVFRIKVLGVTNADIIQKGPFVKTASLQVFQRAYHHCTNY